MTAVSERVAVATTDIAAAWPRELLGVALLVVDGVDSTQRLARALLDRQLAEDEDPLPLLVVALEQSAGRGRRGRGWISAPGAGVWASLLVGIPTESLPTVPMRSAAALAVALEESAPGLRIRIKWPNDLVIGRRKLGGILVDVTSRPGGRSFAIVGFGVNVRQAEEELPLAGAISLRVALRGGEPPALGELVARCARGLWRTLGREVEWLDRYRALSAHVEGDELACDLDGERVSGRFLGFDERGFLRLETERGERRISSGDVFRW